MALSLKIKTEWSSYTLDLSQNESIRLGRAADATIQIPRSSVSQYHLELTFTGDELVFRDLGSSNGSYRMPQDSPIVEARFSARTGNVTIKISKSLVEFEWSIRSVSLTDAQSRAFDPTRTEVVPDSAGNSAADSATQHVQHPATVALPDPGQNELPAVTVAITKPERPRARVDQRETAKHQEQESAGQVVAAVAAQVRTPKKSKRQPVDAREHQLRSIESSAWLLAALGSACAFLVSFFFGRFVLQGIVSAHGAQLRNGGMIDVLIIWGGFLVNRTLVSAIFVVAVSAIFYLAIRYLRSGQSGLVAAVAKRLVGRNRAPIFLPQVLTLIFYALFFVWPLAWAAFYRTSPANIVDAVRFWQVLNRPVDVPGDRIQQLRALLPKLQGSSLLYKEIYLIQRQRILQECKGVGTDAPWDDKKVCLVLLTAVAIESLEEVQPGLMGDVAARAAILLSLDGISRVVGVEGIEAPTLPFFLNSLDAVGLGPEREDIEKLINRPGATPEEVLSSLLDLRKRIELRLEARQVEMRLPRMFTMRFPSPIESGI